MKEKLNEYKFVVAAVDSVLNTNDPVKTAVAHAGLYTSIYAVILASNPSVLTLVSVLLAIYLTVETFIGKFNEKVFASRPFTDEQEGRFHNCSKGRLPISLPDIRTANLGRHCLHRKESVDGDYHLARPHRPMCYNGPTSPTKVQRGDRQSQRTHSEEKGLKFAFLASTNYIFFNYIYLDI